MNEHKHRPLGRSRKTRVKQPKHVAYCKIGGTDSIPQRFLFFVMQEEPLNNFFPDLTASTFKYVTKLQQQRFFSWKQYA